MGGVNGNVVQTKSTTNQQNSNELVMDELNRLTLENVELR